MILLLTASVFAHDPNVDPTDVPEGTVVIDGDLSDAAWATAPVLPGMLRFRPTDGGPPPGETTVRLLRDDHFLYVSIAVRDAERPVRARISPREDINDDDQIGIYLDPFDAAQNGFVFYFNARGIQQDIRAEGPSYDGWNFAWDTLLRAEGHVTEDGLGFDLEVGIPFRSLKYPSGGGTQSWGFLVTRKIPGVGAKYSWPKMDRTAPRIFPQAAPIHLVPPPRGSGLELIPGVAAKVVAHGSSVEDTTWATSDPLRTVSLDARYGVTPSTGIGATINPDFSNVEFDQTQIDINHRYPFSYGERRSFFLDGSGYLDDEVGTLHSRSIVEPLYAVKAYSQAGDWSLGFLNAEDASPSESLNVGGSPGFGSFYDDVDELADADAMTTVARLGRNVGEGGHAAVMLVTKEILRGGVHEPLRVDGQHFLGGFDVAVPVGDALTARALGQSSYTSDGAEALVGGSGGAGLSYDAQTQFEGLVYGASSGFRRETGLHYVAGEQGGYVEIAHIFEPAFIDAVRPWASGNLHAEEGYAFGTVEVGNWVQQGARQGSIGFGARREVVPDEPTPVDGGYGWLEASADLGPLLAVWGEVGAERGMVWGQGPGSSGWSSVGFTARPTPGLRADVSWEGQRTSETPFSPAWDTSQRWRTQVQWQFDRVLGARVIEEYADSVDYGRNVTSSVLLTALRNPGTAVYLGYAEVRGLDDDRVLDRAAFAKATVLLRL